MLKVATWSVCWTIIHHFQSGLGNILRQKHKQKKSTEASSNESSLWCSRTLGNLVCSFLGGGIYLANYVTSKHEYAFKRCKNSSASLPQPILEVKSIFCKVTSRINEKYWKWKNPLLDPKQIIQNIVSLHTISHFLPNLTKLVYSKTWILLNFSLKG